MTTLYLTLGASGGIWTGKPNAQTGTGVLHKETSGTSESLYQSAASNVTTTSTFKAVVVGYGGSILLSNRVGNNTGTWATVHSATQPLLAVAYGNGHWVAAGNNNLVLTSSNGSTWTEKAGAVKGAQWTWAAYGNGTFVVVGGFINKGKDTGVVMFSTDNGATWTRGNAGGASHLQSVAYSPQLNVFVAVGTDGSLVSVNG